MKNETAHFEMVLVITGENNETGLDIEVRGKHEGCINHFVEIKHAINEHLKIMEQRKDNLKNLN